MSTKRLQYKYQDTRLRYNNEYSSDINNDDLNVKHVTVMKETDINECIVAKMISWKKFTNSCEK